MAACREKQALGRENERTLILVSKTYRRFVGYRGPDGEGERQGKLPVRGGGGGAGFGLKVDMFT